IGRIEIHDDYSTVDLPEGMPREIFRQLKKAWVCGQKLAIRVEAEGPAAERGHTEDASEAPEKRKRTKPAGFVGNKRPGKATSSKSKSGKPPGFKPKKATTRTKS